MQKPVILPPLCAPPGQFPVPLTCCLPLPSCSPCVVPCGPQSCCPPPCFPPCCPPQCGPPCCPPMCCSPCCSPPCAPCGPCSPASPRCPLPPCIPGKTKFSNCGSCGGRSTIVRVPKGCCPQPCQSYCPCLNMPNCCTPCCPRCACCALCCPPPCNDPCQPSPGQSSNTESDKPPCFNNCNFYCTEIPKGKFPLKGGCADENPSETGESTEAYDACIQDGGTKAECTAERDFLKNSSSRILNRAAGDDQLAPVPRRSPSRRPAKRGSSSSKSDSLSYSSYEYSRSRKHKGQPPRDQEVLARIVERKEDSPPKSGTKPVDCFTKPVVCSPNEKCPDTGVDLCVTWPLSNSRENAMGDGKSVTGKSGDFSLSTSPSLKTSCLVPPNTYISSTNSARLTAKTLMSHCVESVTDNCSSFIIGSPTSVKCTHSKQKSHFVRANQSTLKSTCLKTVVRRKAQVETRTRDTSATSHRTVFVETSKTSHQDKVCETVEFSRIQASSIQHSEASIRGYAPGHHPHGAQGDIRSDIRRLSKTFSNSKKSQKQCTQFDWEFQAPYYYDGGQKFHDKITGKLPKISGDVPRRSPRYVDCLQHTSDGASPFTSSVSNYPSLKKYPVLNYNSLASNQTDVRKVLSDLWDTDKTDQVSKKVGNSERYTKKTERGFYPKVKSSSKEVVPSQHKSTEGGYCFQTSKNFPGIEKVDEAAVNQKSDISAVTAKKASSANVSARERQTSKEEIRSQKHLEKKCDFQTSYREKTCIRYRDGGGDQSRDQDVCVVTCVVHESTKWRPPLQESRGKAYRASHVKTASSSSVRLENEVVPDANVVIEEIIEPNIENYCAEAIKVSDCEFTPAGSPPFLEQAQYANDCAAEEIPSPVSMPMFNMCNTNDNPFELSKLDSAHGTCVKRSLSCTQEPLVDSGYQISGLEGDDDKLEIQVVSIPLLVDNSTNLSVSHFRKKRIAKRRLLNSTKVEIDNSRKNLDVASNNVEDIKNYGNQVNKSCVKDKII